MKKATTTAPVETMKNPQYVKTLYKAFTMADRFKGSTLVAISDL
jgi:hypothetical protein